MTRPTLTIAALGLLTLTLLAGCNNRDMIVGFHVPRGSERPIDSSTVATVRGVVKFLDTAPNPVKINMSADPDCGNQATFSEAVMTDKGNLANVFVYVKDGLGNRTFDPPQDPVTITQEACRYRPHVVGVMAGQPVKFVNSDPTSHNIHPMPKDNRQWNESQLPRAEPILKSFAREEIMLPIQCNQHPWMKMYLNVVKSPYFAVTDESGKFELKGLPPGDYTVAAVHEILGERTANVTVGPKETRDVQFTFGSSAGTAAAQ